MDNNLPADEFIAAARASHGWTDEAWTIVTIGSIAWNAVIAHADTLEKLAAAEARYIPFPTLCKRLAKAEAEVERLRELVDKAERE